MLGNRAYTIVLSRVEPALDQMRLSHWESYVLFTVRIEKVGQARS